MRVGSLALLEGGSERARVLLGPKLLATLCTAGPQRDRWTRLISAYNYCSIQLSTLRDSDASCGMPTRLVPLPVCASIVRRDQGGRIRPVGDMARRVGHVQWMRIRSWRIRGALSCYCNQIVDRVGLYNVISSASPESVNHSGTSNSARIHACLPCVRLIVRLSTQPAVSNRFSPKLRPSGYRNLNVSILSDTGRNRATFLVDKPHGKLNPARASVIAHGMSRSTHVANVPALTGIALSNVGPMPLQKPPRPSALNV